MVVADYNNNRVQLFDLDTFQYISKFSSSNCRGVTFDENGLALVSDYSNKRIIALSPDLSQTTNIFGSGYISGYPYHISFDIFNQRIIISDSSNELYFWSNFSFFIFILFLFSYFSTFIILVS